MEAEQTGFEFERWEKIDGIVYDMTPPPTSQHQSIVGRLQGEFYAYLKGGTCQSFPAAFGVWLDDEDDNYVEPDLTVEVFRLEGNNFNEPQVYGKMDRVSVSLFDGMEIKLADISDIFDR